MSDIIKTNKGNYHHEDYLKMANNTTKHLLSKNKRLETALDKLLVHSIEFYNDWKKGDFDLPRLAQLDMESMAE